MFNEVLHWGWRAIGSLTLLVGAGALGVQYQTDGDPARLWITFGALTVVTIAGWFWWMRTRPETPQVDGGKGAGPMHPSNVTGSAVAQAAGQGSKAQAKQVTKNYFGGDQKKRKEPKEPPDVRLVVTPNRPPNWVHLNVHNRGPSQKFRARGTFLNTGQLPFDEVESEYDVPWRTADPSLEVRINQDGKLDLNFATLDPASQKITDGLAARRATCALATWNVEKSPEPPHYPPVARLRVQSPSAGDAGWFERFVPQGFSLAFRVLISAKKLPSTPYLGEIVPTREGDLLVSIDQEDALPLGMLAMLIELGTRAWKQASSRGLTGLERSILCEDWRVASREVLQRRLGHTPVARMSGDLSRHDHSSFDISIGTEVRNQVFALESDVNWLCAFVAEATP